VVGGAEPDSWLAVAAYDESALAGLRAVLGRADLSRADEDAIEAALAAWAASRLPEDAAAELQRFAAGDLDITETVPPQPLPALRERFGDRLRISPYLGAFWLGLNLTKPPLRDAPALREALSLAVDRDSGSTA